MPGLGTPGGDEGGLREEGGLLMLWVRLGERLRAKVPDLVVGEDEGGVGGGEAVAGAWWRWRWRWLLLCERRAG